MARFARVMPRARAQRSRSEADEIRHRVQAVVDSIPRGKVATYGQVAAIAGLPRRARWVGRVLRELPSGSKLPWHRVIAAGGRIALAHPNGAEQRRRLRREGVTVSNSGRIDLARVRWDGDSSSRPATSLD